MRAFWRYPAVPIGVTLIVLGVGNWSVSRTKVIEYAQRVSAPAPLDAHAQLGDFHRLSPRTNGRLLEGLHRGAGAAGVAEAKRDFYTVVESGGRFIAILGGLLAGVGAFQHWRHRRFGGVPEST
ncbi:MAG: hypothetical protein ABI624_04750 [Casimicrobiaceae bacterium]